MADAPSASAPASAESAGLTVNLRIISPSPGVPNPIVYPDLAVATTIQQLKEKLRAELAVPNPAGVRLRLIHRGRVLDTDANTLLDVFGDTTIRESKDQTLHLVLRDTPQPRPGAQDGQAQVQAPAQFAQAQGEPLAGPRPPNPLAQQQPLPHPVHHHVHFPNPGAPRFGPANPAPLFQNPPAPGPVFPGPQHMLPPQVVGQQQHQTMVQWMNQLQREAGYRQMINNNQRDRAAMGLNGLQDAAARNMQPLQPAAQGRGSPAPHTHTIVREGVAPNGQHWRVTVNETVIPAAQLPLGGLQPGTLQPGGLQNRGPANVPGLGSQPGNGQGRPGALSPLEVQNILRSADATQATQAMTTAMQRSASGASASSIGAAGPQIGVTVPVSLRQTISRAGSRTATPDPGSSLAANAARSLPAVTQPEVYILSSPAGPRALLINNNSEAYYTPYVRLSFQPPMAQRPFSMLSQMPQMPQAPQAQQPHGAADIFELWRRNVARQAPAATPVAPQQQQQQQQQPHPAGQGQAQPNQQVQQAQLRDALAWPAPQANNPGAGALAALWPHIWLLIRLGLFVWWFTTPNSSWYRLATVLSVAIAVFVINTGVLDGFANQAWGPFRRHLEGLLPLAGPNRPVPHAAAAEQMQNDGLPAAHGGATQPRPVPDVGAGAAEPNPAQAAARLVARRRNANADWLLNQVRRLERAGLLFLASIAPGVAERHIAHLEAEARVLRERREAEEAAAAAQAAADAAAAAAADAAGAASGADQNQQAEQQNEGVGGHAAQNGQAQSGQQAQNQPPPEEEPLIAM